MFPQKLVTQLRDRLVQSRFLTVSLTLHAILLLVLGTVIVIKPLSPPEGDFMPTGDLVQKSDAANKPIVETRVVDPAQAFKAVQPNSGGTDFNQQMLIDSVNGNLKVTPPTVKLGVEASPIVPDNPVKVASSMPNGLSAADLKAVGDFRKGWFKSGEGTKNPKVEFTAYLGRYSGNWNSTVRVSNGEITGGSLPNLLYVTTKWSDERIKTNERQVKAIPLDSDELFTTKPPFIFLTGTRDFRLTDKEVENLRKYIRVGGAIWGDSSVPGRRSAFDIAFKREMARIFGEDGKFEALPDNHPIVTNGYIAKFKQLPAGINHYREPVQVIRWGGEIAVIHTGNDYGDMWQIGLDKNGKIDLSKNLAGQYVAMDANLWDNRGVYVRNIEQPAVEDAYKFGINMIMHLVTRWGNRLGNSAPL